MAEADFGKVGCGRYGSESGCLRNEDRPEEAEDPGWIQGLVDVSEKALGNLDTCHHRGRGQISTTTTSKNNVPLKASILQFF